MHRTAVVPKDFALLPNAGGTSQFGQRSSLLTTLLSDNNVILPRPVFLWEPPTIASTPLSTLYPDTRVFLGKIERFLNLKLELIPSGLRERKRASLRLLNYVVVSVAHETTEVVPYQGFEE